MRILLVQQSAYFPSYAGADRSDRLMMSAFVRHGHQCSVVAVANGRTEDDYILSLRDRGITPNTAQPGVLAFTLDAVNVHIVTTSDIRSYALSHLSQFDADLVLVSTDPLNNLISDFTAMAKVKVVYLVRTTALLPFGPQAMFPNKQKVEAIRRANAVIAVSDYLAEYVRLHSGIPAACVPIQMLELGEWRCVGHWDNPFVTMVNPCALKGIAIFLSLADYFPETQFAAVPTWGTTAADRKQLAMRPNICILDPVEDIRCILQQTRVMLVPSLWAEARARIVLESMVGGVPVLASNVGGMREAVMGVPCLLPVKQITQYQNHLDEQKIRVPEVPHQEMLPWRSALRRLISDRDHYMRMSNESRAAATQYVSRLDTTEFEKLLTNLL
jgi:glycosyltransferase involved in cell wall biosynthesis